MLKIFITYADSPINFSYGFKDPATQWMLGIVDLHDNIVYYGIIILTLVLWFLKIVLENPEILDNFNLVNLIGVILGMGILLIGASYKGVEIAIFFNNNFICYADSDSDSVISAASDAITVGLNNTYPTRGVNYARIYSIYPWQEVSGYHMQFKTYFKGLTQEKKELVVHKTKADAPFHDHEFTAWLDYKIRNMLNFEGLSRYQYQDRNSLNNNFFLSGGGMNDLQIVNNLGMYFEESKESDEGYSSTSTGPEFHVEENQDIW